MTLLSPDSNIIPFPGTPEDTFTRIFASEDAVARLIIAVDPQLAVDHYQELVERDQLNAADAHELEIFERALSNSDLLD